MQTIQSLYIYPIKGMRGISVTKAQLQSEGFQYDRRWMLVDKNGTFLSQRVHPLMATFETAIDGTFLKINFQGHSHEFPLDQLSKNELSVTVFDHQMLATEVSPATSEWFSEQLNTPVKLVHHSPITNRLKQFGKYIHPDAQNEIGSNTKVSFADGYPYLLLGTASLELLNTKASHHIKMDRFRPNIVVNTKVAHEEDDWKKIKIKDQQLFNIKPCARCQVPTVDQHTGQQGAEPIKSLVKYRKFGKAINFGTNLISLTSGVISVGDVVNVG